jgi:DNA-cytosine methyltransferase
MFSGIGGFDLGFERAGFRIAWCIEFDKAAQAVLRKRFPHAKIYGDIREVDALELERVDVICGGFPCQDLSVAGKRAGLSGSRSGLFHEAIRIVRAIKPAIVLLENVPGLLSSNQGHDFATVIRELGEGWPCAEVAWRVLDSQYFGVAQRRRRVFIVASAAIGHAEQVLALIESVCGNPPTRQPKRQDFAASSQGSVRASFQTAIAESEVSSTICAQFGLSRNNYEERVAATLQTTCNDGPAGNECGLFVAEVQSFTGSSFGQYAEGVGTLRAKGGDAGGGSETIAVAHTIAHAFYSTGGTHGLETHSEISPPLKVGTTLGVPSGVAVAHTIDMQASKGNAHVGNGDVSPTLSKMHGHEMHAVCAIPLDLRNATRNAEKLDAKNRQGCGIGNDGDPSFTLMQHPTPGVATPMVVRRLTPVECERLQGFPDGWTDIGTLEKPTADSHRYKQLGNAVTVNVAQWIAQKIEETI